MNTPTVGQLYDFIVKHKTDKVFMGMTHEQIASKLFVAIPQEELYYSVDASGKIDGMILAEIDRDRKYCWVSENLALTMSNLRKFAKKFNDKYPGFTLDWKKNGKYKHHNTTKLLQKLHVI